MSHIFLDESGDFGFNPKKKNSKFFIITVVAFENQKPIERIVKKTHSELRKRVKRLSGGVLHCVKEKPVTRKRLLNRINKIECSIMTIYLNKKNVYTKLKDERHILYNYVTNILLDRILQKKLVDSTKEIILIASKRETNKFLNENFKSYLENQTKYNHKTNIQIVIKSPSEEKGLQAVDFVSWAIFRKYEKNDSSYYELIKKHIVEENGLFTS
ncbi:hypothetical protein A2966_01310 [Candidatus Roizmanbacteria bacterium RIFCSPLOWO2_01_FULL_41_22]|uniref:DUF3800 domain-containing protein n=2 Tax=Candidatus Roizmaniibacteriota TaxID=1752723 RepID=A0A1F7JQM7_9BACT|nr:MAG: hypothetical protein A2966_01310 [Candidatus Roizmanbacteria bacterium RIFCSPLOWO2_01_FULL_41_22]OGK57905.1 MAG: hypothetical protein A3H86_03685 [Candidatus Roizmanbacteria bacterium RIFCSPLOWO2_02_FULL_41_9]